MTSKVNTTPLEDDEAIVFHQWLEVKGIPHTHIANEIGGSTQAAKVRALKAKKMGQSAGVWDYEVFIPIFNHLDGEVDCYQEARIELKRKRGGTVSQPQKEWGEIYELAGIPHRICKGADEAIEFVEELLKDINYE